MNVHRIRLRGPWRYEWLSSREEHPPGGRVSLPDEWRNLFGEAEGRVCFQRTFHCPTNLEPGSKVDLVFEGLGGAVRIVLNEQDLTPHLPAAQSESPVRVGIAGLLLPTNDLRVEIDFDPQKSPQPGGLWGTVALEIVE